MPRRARSCLQRLRAQQRAVAPVRLVLSLIVALVAAPAWTAVGNDCGSCSPTCPMHQHHADGQGSPAAHLGCHHSANAAPSQPGGGRADGPTVACATCGHHALLPGTVLPPVILATVRAQTVALLVEALPPRATVPPGRLADPPDPRPPTIAA
jgi:hypothetical protein